VTRSARDRSHGQFRAAEILQNIGLDGAEPRRTHAATARDLRAVTRGAERHGDQVADMGHGQMAQLRRRQGGVLPQDSGVMLEEPQRFVFARNDPHRQSLDIAHERSE
jgi:hypothetical protein